MKPFLILCLLSTQTPALSWDEAMREAGARHPAVIAATSDLASAEADIKLKRAAFLPKVDATADRSTSGSKAYGDQAGWPAGEGDATSDSFSGGLRASWRIFDGFGSLNALQEARHNRNNKSAALAQAEIDARRQLRVAFVRALAAQGQVAVAADIVQRLSVASQYQKLKYEAGRQARWTWTKAQADALDAAWRLDQSKSELDLANRELSVALGLGPSVVSVAEGSLETQAASALELGALEALPAFKKLALQILAAQDRVEATNAANWPSLSANAGWTYNGGRNWPPATRTWSLGVSAAYNLFNGGATFFAKSEAEQGLVSLKQLATQSRQNLELSLRRAHARTLSAIKRVDVADAQLAAARERYDTVAKLGQAGRVGYLDLEQAESGLAGAQQQGLALRQEAALAAAELDAAAGLGLRFDEKGKR